MQEEWQKSNSIHGDLKVEEIISSQGEWEPRKGGRRYGP